MKIIKFGSADTAEALKAFSDFAALSDEDRAAQFAAMDDAAVEAALTEALAAGTVIFAKEDDAITMDDASAAKALTASMGLLDAEKDRRDAEVEQAAADFAAAKATFADSDKDKKSKSKKDDKKEFPFANDAEDGDEDEDEDAEDGDDTEDEDAEDGDESEDGDDSEDGEGGDEAEAAVTAAAAARGRRALPKKSAAKSVGSRANRPTKAATKDVVITAGANIADFSAGQVLDGMTDVAKALISRANSMPKFNKVAAQQNYDRSEGQPMLSDRLPVAGFGVNFKDSLVASATGKGDPEKDHSVIKAALSDHRTRIANLVSGRPDVETAAMAWCSPSEVVYNWISDFVVDGLLDLPEIAAPRGGLIMTEGPRLLQGTYGTDAATDGFGFGGTEAEMEAGYVKTCETIECPDWEDHRLDFDGYCWKIPILTEATFPELVADALRVSDVAYAHKMNRRFIRNVLAESTDVDATNAMGGSMLDTLEAFTQVAIKERRWWNLGENATMEVKLPQIARHIFKMDMARRSGLALSDTATDQRVAAHFAAHNLAVTYISDYQQSLTALSGTPTAEWPETISGIMYPVGTFLKSVKPVINLSAVYDAASLSENEYTGVFFEQGVMVLRRGYRSHEITVPVCVAGRTGANDLTCDGFDVPAFDGDFSS